MRQHITPINDEIWYVYWDNRKGEGEPLPRVSGPFQTLAEAEAEQTALVQGMRVQKAEIVRFVREIEQKEIDGWTCEEVNGRRYAHAPADIGCTLSVTQLGDIVLTRPSSHTFGFALPQAVVRWLLGE